jgi:hypothetical protein
MMLVPYVGETPIDTSTIVVRTDPDDQKRVDFLVSRCRAVTHVDDQHTRDLAGRLGGEIKAMEDAIQAAKKGAKGPFSAIENAIEGRAKEISAPLLAEKRRIAGLLGAYVDRLEEAERAERAKREAQLEAQVREQQQRIKEAELAKLKAEEEARAAKSETEKVLAKERVQAQLAIAAQAQLATEMAEEAARIGAEKALRGKIPGGRVNHTYDYKIVDLRAILKAGYMGLLRWEIDKMACRDEIRRQLEKNPDAEPQIPGLQITKITNVSLKPSARIQ